MLLRFLKIVIYLSKPITHTNKPTLVGN